MIWVEAQTTSPSRLAASITTASIAWAGPPPTNVTTSRPAVAIARIERRRAMLFPGPVSQTNFESGLAPQCSFQRIPRHLCKDRPAVVRSLQDLRVARPRSMVERFDCRYLRPEKQPMTRKGPSDVASASDLARIQD